MEKRREQSMSDVETDEAKKARQQSSKMGGWMREKLEAGQLEELYKTKKLGFWAR